MSDDPAVVRLHALRAAVSAVVRDLRIGDVELVASLGIMISDLIALNSDPEARFEEFLEWFEETVRTNPWRPEHFPAPEPAGEA